MFNFADQKDVSVMKPALRKEGCKLKGVKRNEDSSFQVDFVDSVGAILSHREFVPKRINEQMPDDEFKKSITLSVSRLAHITRAFVSQAEYDAIKVEDPNNLNKAAENFMSVTKQMGALLKAKIETGADVTCALKVVYAKNKDKYYAGFPKVPSFVSTANHPKDFVSNPAYDIFDIPAVMPSNNPAPTQEGLGKSPLGNATTDSDF